MILKVKEIMTGDDVLTQMNVIELIPKLANEHGIHYIQSSGNHSFASFFFFFINQRVFFSFDHCTI